MQLSAVSANCLTAQERLEDIHCRAGRTGDSVADVLFRMVESVHCTALRSQKCCTWIFLCICMIVVFAMSKRFVCNAHQPLALNGDLHWTYAEKPLAARQVVPPLSNGFFIDINRNQSPKKSALRPLCQLAMNAKGGTVSGGLRVSLE